MSSRAALPAPVRIDELGFEKRNHRQLGAGGVAAGIGNQPRALDLVSIHLGEAVHRLALQIGRGMGVTVPACIGCGIAQAKISRQVDHLRARCASEQILDHLLRRGVRQRAERNVEAELRPIGVLDRTQCR
jgi:hypothetical protein